MTGSPAYKDSTTSQGQVGRAFIVQHFKLFSELTHPNYRQLEDPVFNEICTCARHGVDPGPERLKLLNAKFAHTIGAAASRVPSDALWTATTWNIVDDLNAKDFEHLCSSGGTPVNVFAKYVLSFSSIPKHKLTDDLHVKALCSHLARRW